MKIDAVFIGDKEVEDFLKEIPKKFTPQFTNAAAVAVLRKYTIADAKRRVKAQGLHKTGALYNSLKVWTYKKGVMAGARKRIISKEEPGKYIKNYAFWVEHGHKDRGGNFIPARPFFRPAWEATKDRVLNEMKEMFWKKIDDYAKRRGWT